MSQLVQGEKVPEKWSWILVFHEVQRGTQLLSSSNQGFSPVHRKYKFKCHTLWYFSRATSESKVFALWEAVWGSRGRAPLILNLGTRWRWLLFPSEEDPVARTNCEAGGALKSVWTFWRTEKLKYLAAAADQMICWTSCGLPVTITTELSVFHIENRQSGRAYFLNITSWYVTMISCYVTVISCYYDILLCKYVVTSRHHVMLLWHHIMLPWRHVILLRYHVTMISCYVTMTCYISMIACYVTMIYYNDITLCYYDMLYYCDIMPLWYHVLLL